MSPSHPSYTATRGTTLIEVVTAILVLGIAIPPLIGLFTEVSAHTVDDTFQGVALSYADAMLEEIVSKSFEDPEAGSGSFGKEEGSRLVFDDIDDYDGLSNSPPVRFNGTLLDDYGGFTRSVKVDNVTAVDPDPVVPAADGSTEFKRIRVKVQWDGGKGGELTLATLRTLLSAGAGNAALGPLDEGASAASAIKKKKNNLGLMLISTASVDVELSAFSLSATSPGKAAKKLKLAAKNLKLAGKSVWVGGAGMNLPTGKLSLNMGSAAQRTISAGGAPKLDVVFNKTKKGPLDFTLVLIFTDGRQSTMTFTIPW